MITTGHAFIEIGGNKHQLPEKGSRTALHSLVDQKVVLVESVEEERVELSFSNGAVLTFLFEPSLGWIPYWIDTREESRAIAADMVSRRHA